MRTLACMCSAVLLALGGFGCGGPAEQGGESQTGEGGAAIQKISTENLPKLASPIAPIDDGRLEIAPPEKWHVPPRSSKWLARFQADPGSPYPMIFVTAENSDDLFHVTKDNVNELVSQIRKELQADPDTKRLAAGVQAVAIGGFRGVLYQRWGKASNWVMERWMLETVANGRRYTVELRSREGSADVFRPHLFAVAAGMKFTKGTAGGSALTAMEETPDDKAAEEAPEKPAADAEEADAEKADAEKADVAPDAEDAAKEDAAAPAP
ncbi:MAG: hypothetical protein U1E05_16805 [Patescibacteria group bacterium]|nr:hypothetical protein [Patescibacteria group bacterium]